MFWTFLKLVFSCLKIVLFFKEYQKTIFPYWLCPKSTNGQIPWTNPFGKFRFCERFEKFFLSRISKNVLFRLDLPKKLNEKNGHFLLKCMDSPLWKISIFWDFLKVDLCCLEVFFFFPEYRKTISSD